MVFPMFFQGVLHINSPIHLSLPSGMARGNVTSLKWSFQCEAGWPTSMPDGYDEYMAYELVISIVATPMTLGHLVLKVL